MQTESSCCLIWVSMSYTSLPMDAKWNQSMFLSGSFWLSSLVFFRQPARSTSPTVSLLIFIQTRTVVLNLQTTFLLASTLISKTLKESQLPLSFPLLTSFLAKNPQPNPSSMSLTKKFPMPPSQQSLTYYLNSWFPLTSKSLRVDEGVQFSATVGGKYVLEYGDLYQSPSLLNSVFRKCSLTTVSNSKVWGSSILSRRLSSKEGAKLIRPTWFFLILEGGIIDIRLIAALSSFFLSIRYYTLNQCQRWTAYRVQWTQDRVVIIIQMSNIDNYLPDRAYGKYQPYETDNYSEDYKKDLLRSEIDTLNCKMSATGIPALGNLFSGTVDEVQKTLESVRMLLSHRHKDMVTRSELVDKIKRLQIDKQAQQLSTQKLLKDKNSLQNEKEQLRYTMKSMEKFFKEQTDKLINEKKYIQRDLIAIQNRESQFNNDYRKKQQKIQDLEDKFKKFITDKQPPKNTSQLIVAIDENGPSVYYLNADHQYSQMIQKNSDETYKKLTRENTQLKQSLGSIYKELNGILEMRKELLVRRKNLDSENFDVNGLNLSTFKMDLFNMPLEHSRDAIELLDDNLRKFRDQMDRLDIIGSQDKSEGDGDKIKTLKNVKGLIQNYKYIVDSQDQMLNKVIMRAKDLKMSEVKGMQNRFSRGLEEDQIKNARRFIQDQKLYLESKDKQLEITRKAMSVSIKRVEEQKNEMNRRRKQIEEEGNKLKRQIQLLPCIVGS